MIIDYKEQSMTMIKDDDNKEQRNVLLRDEYTHGVKVTASKCLMKGLFTILSY